MDTAVAPDVDEQADAPPAGPGAWRVLADAFGVFDWITVLGVTMLLVGLWAWVGGGPALAGVGALVVWMGIAGGRAAARAATAAADVVDELVDEHRGPVVIEER